MTTHYAYSTDLPVNHPNPRNIRPFTCKTQADSTASCTQKVMNIIIIVILLFLLYQDYCSFYVEFLKRRYYYVIVLYATFTLLCMQVCNTDGRKIGDKKKKTFLTATTMLPLYPSECRMPVFQAP